MKSLLALLLIGMLASACVAPAAASLPSTSAPASTTPSVGEQQQHEAGAVTVTAAWFVGTASVLVGLDTHSVDLERLDLRQLARVRLDGGEWVTPTLWDGTQDSHHRSGTLTFGSIQPQAFDSAALIELEIRDAGAPSHLLRWERAR